MNEELKKKAESLIYFMQKECARDSWADFLENLEISEDDEEVIFKSIADSLGLDGSKFYFAV